MDDVMAEFGSRGDAFGMTHSDRAAVVVAAGGRAFPDKEGDCSDVPRGCAEDALAGGGYL